MGLLDELRKIGAIGKAGAKVVESSQPGPTPSVVSVVADETNNSEESLNAGILTVDARVQPQQPANQPETAQTASVEDQVREAVVGLMGPFLRAFSARLSRLERVQSVMHDELTALRSDLTEYESVFKELGGDE